MIGNQKHTRHGRGCYAVLMLIGVLMAGNLMADQQFEELNVNGEVFKKVTVTSKSSTDIFLSHSRGLTTLKVAELDSESRALLGYEAAKPKAAASMNLQALKLPDLGDGPPEEQVEAMKAQLIEQWKSQFGHLNPVHIALGILGVFLVMYLFTCYCFHLICKKTGNNPGIVVWLPLLQLFPLLKAAGMGSWWFFMFFLAGIAPAAAVPLMKTMGTGPALLLALVPQVLALAGMIIWCFKISQARGVGTWFGVLLLLPVVSLFAFLYLAFGNPTPDIHSKADYKTGKWGKTRAQDTSFFAQT